MEFAVLSISHKKADESIRSHVAFMDTQKIECYERLLELEIYQAVMVATCNRSELYFFYERKEQLQQVVALFEEMAGIDLHPYLIMKQAKAALIYLYEVCCGYHSMILGEDQIEGQIQEAYRFATQMQACKKQMHRIFQNCFKVVKQIKTKYQISVHPLSLPYIAMCQIKKQMTLENKVVFIIGSGDMAKLFLTYCRQEAVSKLYVCSRNIQHAEMLKVDERIEVVSFQNRYEYLLESDLVFSATSSPHQILCLDQYPRISHPQLSIDLAIPCDIDKRIQSLGVEIIGMDDLSLVKNKHRKKRKELLDEAHEELLQGVVETMEWLDTQDVQQVISSLQRKSEESAEAAYQMIVSKITLDHHEQKVVKKILKASFYRMVKEPMMMLSQNKDHPQDYLNIITQLFQREEK